MSKNSFNVKEFAKALGPRVFNAARVVEEPKLFSANSRKDMISEICKFIDNNLPDSVKNNSTRAIALNRIYSGTITEEFLKDFIDTKNEESIGEYNYFRGVDITIEGENIYKNAYHRLRDDIQIFLQLDKQTHLFSIKKFLEELQSQHKDNWRTIIHSMLVNRLSPGESETFKQIDYKQCVLECVSAYALTKAKIIPYELNSTFILITYPRTVLFLIDHGSNNVQPIDFGTVIIKDVTALNQNLLLVLDETNVLYLYSLNHATPRQEYFTQLDTSDNFTLPLQVRDIKKEEKLNDFGFIVSYDDTNCKYFLSFLCSNSETGYELTNFRKHEDNFKIPHRILLSEAENNEDSTGGNIRFICMNEEQRAKSVAKYTFKLIQEDTLTIKVTKTEETDSDNSEYKKIYTVDKNIQRTFVIDETKVLMTTIESKCTFKQNKREQKGILKSGNLILLKLEDSLPSDIISNLVALNLFPKNKITFRDKNDIIIYTTKEGSKKDYDLKNPYALMILNAMFENVSEKQLTVSSFDDSMVGSIPGFGQPTGNKRIYVPNKALRKRDTIEISIKLWEFLSNSMGYYTKGLYVLPRSPSGEGLSENVGLITGSCSQYSEILKTIQTSNPTLKKLRNNKSGVWIRRKWANNVLEKLLKHMFKDEHATDNDSYKNSVWDGIFATELKWDTDTTFSDKPLKATLGIVASNNSTQFTNNFCLVSANVSGNLDEYAEAIETACHVRAIPNRVLLDAEASSSTSQNAKLNEALDVDDTKQRRSEEKYDLFRSKHFLDDVLSFETLFWYWHDLFDFKDITNQNCNEFVESCINTNTKYGLNRAMYAVETFGESELIDYNDTNWDKQYENLTIDSTSHSLVADPDHWVNRMHATIVLRSYAKFLVQDNLRRMKRKARATLTLDIELEEREYNKHEPESDDEAGSQSTEIEESEVENETEPPNLMNIYEKISQLDIKSIEEWDDDVFQTKFTNVYGNAFFENRPIAALMGFSTIIESASFKNIVQKVITYHNNLIDAFLQKPANIKQDVIGALAVQTEETKFKTTLSKCISEGSAENKNAFYENNANKRAAIYTYIKNLVKTYCNISSDDLLQFKITKRTNPTEFTNQLDSLELGFKPVNRDTFDEYLKGCFEIVLETNYRTLDVTLSKFEPKITQKSNRNKKYIDFLVIGLCAPGRNLGIVIVDCVAFPVAVIPVKFEGYESKGINDLAMRVYDHFREKTSVRKYREIEIEGNGNPKAGADVLKTEFDNIIDHYHKGAPSYYMQYLKNNSSYTLDSAIKTTFSFLNWAYLYHDSKSKISNHVAECRLKLAMAAIELLEKCSENNTYTLEDEELALVSIAKLECKTGKILFFGTSAAWKYFEQKYKIRVRGLIDTITTKLESCVKFLDISSCIFKFSNKCKVSKHYEYITNCIQNFYDPSWKSDAEPKVIISTCRKKGFSPITAYWLGQLNFENGDKTKKRLHFHWYNLLYWEDKKFKELKNKKYAKIMHHPNLPENTAFSENFVETTPESTLNNDEILRRANRTKDFVEVTTKEYLTLDKNAWSTGNPKNFVITEIFNLKITSQIMLNFKDNNPVPEEIIEGYIKLLEKRCKAKKSCVHFMNSRQCKIILNNKNAKIGMEQNPAHGIDLKEAVKRGRVFFQTPPEQTGNLNTLMVLDFNKKSCEYYHPFGDNKNANELRDEYLNWMKSRSIFKPQKKDFKITDLNDNFPQLLSNESANYSGIYVMQYMNYLSDDQKLTPFTFSVNDVDYFKRRVTQELVDQKLLAPEPVEQDQIGE